MSYSRWVQEIALDEDEFEIEDDNMGLKVYAIKFEKAMNPDGESAKLMSAILRQV